MMKRINILYILAIVAFVILWKVSSQYNEEAVIFYGFAENKETEINLEHPVQVDKIYVTTGQEVALGTPLIQVSHNKLPLKLNDLVHELEETKVEKGIWEADVQADIDELKAKKAVKTSEINAKIAQIEAKIIQNQSLLKEINAVDVSATNEQSEVTKAKIDALKGELAIAIQPLDVEINRLEQKLKEKNPYSVKLNRLSAEQSFYDDKGRQFEILAPTDGLIGNIHCKEAENITSFKTLITFYEENPTLVIGFVHENMVIHVNVGDSLTVVSAADNQEYCRGIVTGLGSRIVEIPNRLRRYPEIKNYGREVLIKIPAQNGFLQKEKVVLKLDETIETTKNFWDIIFGKSVESSERLVLE